MNGVAVFFIVIIILALFAFAGFTIFTRLRARRLGLPPPPLNPFASRSGGAPSNYTFPAPAPGGVIGWVNSKLAALKNRRSAAGAYEEPLASGGGYGGSGRGRRGFGPLDPDEAWDARVGEEAGYGGYEEQELGLHSEGHGYAPPGEDTGYHPYGGAQVTPAGSANTPPSSGYGPAGAGYEEETRGRSRSREIRREDPFADENAMQGSLRGVSPRPADEVDDREARRSAFREGL